MQQYKGGKGSQLKQLTDEAKTCLGCQRQFSQACTRDVRVVSCVTLAASGKGERWEKKKRQG